MKDIQKDKLIGAPYEAIQKLLLKNMGRQKMYIHFAGRRS